MRPRRGKSQEEAAAEQAEEEEGERSDAGGESSPSSSDSSVGNSPPISKKKRRITPESSSDSEASEGEGRQGSTREAPSKKTHGDHHVDRGQEEEMPSDDEDSFSSINTQDEIKAELEELKSHEKFCNRDSAKKSQHRHKDNENERDGEESRSLPPINPLCRNCSPPKSMSVLVSTKEKSPGKHFFKCDGCDEFLWADDPSVMSRMPVGRGAIVLTGSARTQSMQMASVFGSAQKQMGSLASLSRKLLYAMEKLATKKKAVERLRKRRVPALTMMATVTTSLLLVQNRLVCFRHCFTWSTPRAGLLCTCLPRHSRVARCDKKEKERPRSWTSLTPCIGIQKPRSRLGKIPGVCRV